MPDPRDRDVADAGDELFEAVRGYVERSVEPVAARVAQIAADIAAKASADYVRAEVAGAKSAVTIDLLAALSKTPDGKTISVEDVRPMVESAIAALPKPKDGEPGKDADLDAVREFVAREVSSAFSAIRIPTDGAPGKDGASVDPAAVEAMVAAQVARAVPAAIEPARELSETHVKNFADAFIAQMLAAALEPLQQPSQGN